MKRLAILLFVLLGCSKNDPSLTSICYIKSINYEFSTGPISHNISYDNENRVKSIEEKYAYGQTVNYSYDSRGNMISALWMEPNSCCTHTWTYTYDGQNKLIEENDDAMQENTKFQYNSSGLVASVTITTHYAGTERENWIFEYPNSTTKNISKITVSKSDNPIPVIIQLKYDNKPNPYKVLFPNMTRPPIHGFLSFINDWQLITDNNIIKMTESCYLGDCITDFSYTYNGNGYPISITPFGYTLTYQCK